MTHSTHPNVIDYYEQIASKSGEMLLAAKAGDWDMLCQKENESANLIEQLRALGEQPVLNDTDRKRRLQLLKKILADDAQIRELTEPWVKQLQSMLHSSQNSRRLGAAYS
ncbi:flagellar protein FliT [Parvibium lacunae]|uniref:Flagellar protein FliT n=1 Tax=Parvibium lacunae TaxID=1888893 RepID=A0A368L3U2_9BURK|nr:flagellar protein FliT [Parvibium lacunae]RCS58224.1 flagellar protein FliT [Parvibium lacunae]